MTMVAVHGRQAFADLLRLLAAQVESGALTHPFSIHPAPHLGPFAVRLAGVDYDLVGVLPGVISEHAADGE